MENKSANVQPTTTTQTDANADVVVKCKKQHKCDYCGGQINVGEMAMYFEGRVAKYNKDNKQVGVDFWKSWLHVEMGICRANGAD